MDNHRGQRGFACEACIKRKVRCNRSDPCRHCERRGEACVYALSGEEFERSRRRQKELKIERRKVGQRRGTVSGDVETARTITSTLLGPAVGLLEAPYGSTRTLSKQEFAALYPSEEQTRELCDIFLTNVNPVTRVLPEWRYQEILNSSQGDPGSASPVVHAFKLAIISMAIWSADDQTCFDLMGERKTVSLDKYQSRAGILLRSSACLCSTDVLAVHASYIYVLSLADRIDPTATWSFLATLLRQAELVNLHRDPSNFQVSGFDTEYRRRLWMGIQALERRLGELCSSDFPMFRINTDVRSPCGVDDNRMRLDMPAMEYGDCTPSDCMLTMVRNELSAFEAEIPWTLEYCGGPRYLYYLKSPVVPLSDKEKAVGELESRLQYRYLAHCDPVNPVHLFASIVARCMPTIFRLVLYETHYRLNNQSPPRDNQRNPVSLARKALEYHLLFMTAPSLGRFRWHTRFQVQWAPFLLLIQHLRDHATGQEAQSGWKLLTEAFDTFTDLCFSMSKPIHSAAGTLLKQAWEAYKSRGPTDKSGDVEPAFIRFISQAKTTFHKQQQTNNAVARNSNGGADVRPTASQQSSQTSETDVFAGSSDDMPGLSLWSYLTPSDLELLDFDANMLGIL